MAKNEIKSVIRPPVVAVMGHIDHGKSTLLDYIRKTNIVAREAGGITQRMSAYKVLRKDPSGKEASITFLDTPGHEAFKALRSRGARVADIAILVVAADEGVKPQTVEALKAIREAKLPFVVAMNKIDRPNANVDRLKQTLAENEIFVEGYGGDVPAIPVSAITGEGVEDLLDMILLMAEMADLKGRLDVPAEGIVIGAENNKTKGIGATIIIKNGSIKSGMYVVCDCSFSPTRILEDFNGKSISEAGPGDPIRITGFNKLPPVGSIIICAESKKTAEELAHQSELETKKTESVIEIGPANATVSIPVIIKASTTDVVEAIVHEMQKIQNDRVLIKIISTGIGFIGENDIKLAMTKEGSVVMGFDTKIDTAAKNLAERTGVEIQIFNIIYKLTEWLDDAMKARRPKIKSEEVSGRAKVIRLFSKTKDKQVLGGKVESGSIETNEEVKIIRRDSEIGRGRIKNLQQSKVEVKEIKEGLEFGAVVEAKFELAPGDRLEAYKIIES